MQVRVKIVKFFQAIKLIFFQAFRRLESIQVLKLYVSNALRMENRDCLSNDDEGSGPLTQRMFHDNRKRSHAQATDLVIR